MVVREVEPLTDCRTRAKDQLARLPSTMRRFLNPKPYFVGLSEDLHETKLRLIAKARGGEERP
jgi:hypothetical protein